MMDTESLPEIRKRLHRIAELSEDEDRILQADISFTMKSELFRQAGTAGGNVQTMTINMKNLDYDYLLRELTVD